MREINMLSLITAVADSPLRRYVRYNLVLAAALWFLAGFSIWMAYNIRFEFHIPQSYLQNLLLVIGLACIIKPILFFALGAHKSNWRYVTFRDLEIVVLPGLISSAILLVCGFFSTELYIPRGVIIIDFIIFVLLAGQIRISARIVREALLPEIRAARKGGFPSLQSTIIIGAGDGAEMLLREIRSNHELPYDVKAIFDDDPKKHGGFILGKKIVGRCEEIAQFASNTQVDLAIVAIPSASGSRMSRFVKILKPLGLPIKTLPHTLEIIFQQNVARQLRNLNISDLLGRDEITVNANRIQELIRDKVVLVTGAAGSIGTEICLQVITKHPKKLVTLDKSENLLFHLQRKLLSVNGEAKRSPVYSELCDLRDFTSLKRAMVKHSPALVLHAAAHKHVFLQELNPLECFNNNVGGMRNIVRLSEELGVERFVLISTDKAVNPTSVMGATKRICEMYCQGYASFSKTSFMTVRFGNVMGSEGSVIPIFMEQIATGGPVTVTHPEAKRYFMTIPEAVILVLQASAIGASGQIMMLDMGEPVGILDLARQLISIAGKSEDEVPIEFTGLKSGEKLFEDLKCHDELCMATEHEKIHILKSSIENPREAIQKIDHLLKKSNLLSDGEEIRLAISDIVPEYQRGVSRSPTADIEISRKTRTFVKLRETSSRLALN